MSGSSRTSSLRSAGALALEPGSPKAAIPATAADPSSPKSNGKRLNKQVSFGSNDGAIDKAPPPVRRPSLDKQANSSSRSPSLGSTRDNEPSLASSTRPTKGFFAKKEVKNPMLLTSTASEPKPDPSKQLSEKGSGRRRSLPCLKVSTTKVVESGEKRRVSFGGGSPDLYEAFTPYCKKYGAHPSEFYFDAEGHMVLEDLDGLEDDVKVGDTLECVVDCGVTYRKKPQMTARFDDLRTLDLSSQTKVLQRCGDWVRDSVGWLPLTINSTPVLEVIVPKEKLKYGNCRVAVAVLDKSAGADEKEREKCG